MSMNLISVGLDSTIRLSRWNVREIDLDFDSEHAHFRLKLSNESAATLAEQIIALIGCKVVLPVEVSS